MALGEFDIIAKYFAGRATSPGVLLGVGDDAAVLAAREGRRLVLAMDTIAEGVHFLPGAAGADVGYRALAVNLSDLAAMGAEPDWMSLSLSIPDANESWLTGFASGLFQLAAQHDVQLIGGDTVRGPLVVTIQVGGWVEPDRWLTRAGARPGDGIYVTGTLGDAAAGLALSKSDAGGEASETASFLQGRFLRPTPRIATGRRLRTLASAAMDISDGLLTDAEKLCASSGCGARLDIDRLPLSRALREHFDAETALQFALAGGDDYELLVTAPSACELEREGLTKIGEIVAGSGVECVRGGGPYVLQRTGYDHFPQ
jgi:thiamine-monophosphate kinase